MSALISALAWVPQGRSQRHPSKYQLDEKELARVSALARTELEGAKEALEKAEGKNIVMAEDADGKIDDEGWESDEDSNASKSGDEDDSMAVDDEAPKPAAAPTGPADPNDLSAYNLDTYDEEESKGAATGVFSNIKGLTYYRNAEDDPFITLKENEDDLEREDLEVLPTDNLLITAKTEDDLSQLEIHVYDETEENLYVHHDLMLPAFPLCLEWLDFPPNNGSSENSNNGVAGPSKTHGSYIAVGTFDPEIEIWSLDTVDGLYPDALLGRPDESKQHVPVALGTGKKKKKLVKARTANPNHHVDAVLSLAWNTQHRSLLASASADETVKLWDLSRPSTEPAVRSFHLHQDKVQAVEWNKTDPTVLLTGSYDRTVRTWDTRAPGSGVGAFVGSDVEALKWDPFDSHAFYVSLESGLILNFDTRKLSSSNLLNNPTKATAAKFTLSAHEGAASSLDVSPHVRGCLATGGTDKMVKLWNINENEDTTGKREVSLVTSRDLGVGKVFSVHFSPDTPLTLAAAGSKAKLQVWDLASNAGARKAFGQRLRKHGRELREAKESGQGLIGVQSDGEDSEEEMDE